MSKTSITSQPWFKFAAAAEVADNQQVEQAFADQAYQLVANKSGALMKDPYRLGFEVVWRNDTATRLVGLYAFRVGRRLLYVPVFFMHGDICGPDLLYQVDRRKFCPNTPEFADFIISRDAGATSIGEGKPQSVTRAQHPQHYLNRLAMPPSSDGTVKYAADRSELHAAWEKFFDEDLAVTKSAEEILDRQHPELLVQYLAEDGTMNKLAALLDKHQAFAETFLDAFDLQDLAPAIGEQMRKNAEVAVKSAAAQADTSKPELPVITMAYGLNDYDEWTAGQIAKMASARGGLTLFDSRDADACSQLLLDDSSTLVKQANAGENLTGVSTPGKYQFVLASGEVKPGILLSHCDEFELLDGGYNGYISDSIIRGTRADDLRSTPRRIVVYDDGSVTTCALPRMQSRSDLGTAADMAPVGEWQSDLSETDGVFFTGDKLKEGKVYWPVLDLGPASGIALGFHPVRYAGKGTARGKVQKLRFAGRWPESNIRELIWNPDLPKSDVPNGLLGQDIQFLEVKVQENPPAATDCNPPSVPDASDSNAARLVGRTYRNGFKVVDGERPATLASLTHILLRSPETLEIKLRKSAGDYLVRTPVGDLNTHKTAHVVHFLGGALKLHGDAIEELLHTADECEGKICKAYVVSENVAELRKRAAAFMRPGAEPSFTTTTEPDFGLTVQQPQRFVIPAETYSPSPAPGRAGDAWDPTLGHGGGNAHSTENDSGNVSISHDELMRLRPEELAQLAQSRSAPAVLDHGAVATLIHMEDAMSYVDKFMPAFEDGVDALGRLIFLFYWKPADFENALGKQEMASFENDLLSNWKSQGRLLLNLLKRLRVVRNTGTTPTAAKQFQR